jgi:acyl-[acyl-carrier-protein]-phospholipid O-acyltransferase/long-chain-fatty-acid--[acyl-carrier-protein] ligase
MVANPSPESSDLNSLPTLPRRNVLSLALVLGATGLNAFNDNILKMMLVGLAPKVAEGALGQEIGAWLGGVILLPFVLFAPLAGWLSDRYSKRGMLIAMLVAQAIILLLTGACFEAEMGTTSVLLALGTFFLLAAQSTFFSPAKMGILKELAGSRRLGMASGWMQMVTMVGILAGLGVGGAWFDSLYESTGNAWQAAATPIWILFAVAVVALIAGLAIQPTPAHPDMKYRTALWCEHFQNLRECLADLPMRRAFVGNSTYWFVASMAAAMFVDIGLALHPDVKAGGAASASSHMTLMVGLGTVAGSVLVAWISRRGLQLGIIPLGAAGLAAALFWAGAVPLNGRSFEAALVGIGLLGGCYMVPIQTYIQDRAAPERRGRVLSSMNLLDSIAGVLAVLLLVGLKAAGLGFAGQFFTLAGLMLVATIYTTNLLPEHLLRFILLAIVRLVYKLRSVNHERVPEQGGVLMLANHVSYVDAMIVGAASGRKVRFVMWDALYHNPTTRWFFELMGTVPISETRAKDAVRTVATALKQGQVVALFPEGQITRHGLFNDLRKGFELMARQGEATVVPVYLEGLYGSIFSHEGGHCFKKWPKKLRYPIGVHFGHPMKAREATAEAVRRQWLDLAHVALQARSEGDAVRQNALVLAEVEWARPGDTLICLAPEGSAIHRTLVAYVRQKSGVHLTLDRRTQAEPRIFIGRAADISTTSTDGARLVMCWDDRDAETPPLALRGLLDQDRLLSISLLDPVMPTGEEGNQRGHLPGSLGRIFNGVLNAKALDAMLEKHRLELTEDGFLKSQTTAAHTPSEAVTTSIE